MTEREIDMVRMIIFITKSIDISFADENEYYCQIYTQIVDSSRNNDIDEKQFVILIKYFLTNKDIIESMAVFIVFFFH
jgi:hypothetical protein